MPIKLPSYLYRSRHGIFYYRISPPIDLRSPHSLKEARISLRTPDRVLAVSVARHLTLRFEGLWKDLRQMEEKDPKTLSPLMVLIKETKKRIRLQDKIQELERQQDEDRTQFDIALKNAKKDAVTAGFLRGLKVGAERAGVATSTAETKTSPLFSQVAADYTRYKLATKKWRPKTIEENKAIYDLFIEINGDLPAGDIDSDSTTHHLEILQCLPANRTKLFPGKTIAEIVALKPEPMSTRNINKNIERLSSVLKWTLSKKKYGVTHNPFSSMTIEETDAKERMPFTKDELLKLFSDESFSKRKFNTNYSYWIMPLALYTGARLNELCQLFLTDIIDVEEVPCINFTDAKEEQRLKNKNSKRIVPIHSQLIKMGLLRYVANLRAAGETQLFPEISARRDGFGATVSKWFGRYKERCGIDDKGVKVFHSFRHTFISNLLDDSVPEYLIAPIVGHEGKLVTSRVYWNARDATKRKPTIEMFQLPSDILKLIPIWEDIKLTKRPGPVKTLVLKAKGELPAGI